MTDAPFALEATEPMIVHARGRLTTMYLLSPFVWADDEGYHLLIRAVPRRDDAPALKIAEIWYGHSDDGLAFTMDEGPVIFPTPDGIDRDGCEDPTVLAHEGRLQVWYSGWHQASETGRLLRAEGRSVHALEKQGVVIDSTKAAQNPKEATVAPAPDGRWRLFHEYAEDGASRIAVLEAPAPTGPWTPVDLAIPVRAGKWDDWHLSTGPMLGKGSDRPVMLYNGATEDAHWRIGWIAFDPGLTRVVDRGAEPVIVAPPTDDESTDIAFAASAVEQDDRVWLYYTLSDKTPMRATLRRG